MYFMQCSPKQTLLLHSSLKTDSSSHWRGSRSFQGFSYCLATVSAKNQRKALKTKLLPTEICSWVCPRHIRVKVFRLFKVLFLHALKLYFRKSFHNESKVETLGSNIKIVLYLGIVLTVDSCRLGSFTYIFFS